MKNTLKKVNTVLAKNQFNSLVAKANKTKEPIIIEKRGEPVAVILDYESYVEQTKEESKQKNNEALTELENLHRYLKQKYPQGTGDSVKILRQSRKERHGYE